MPGLTFYMQVYREPDHGLLTATELRRHFPEARIIVFCDGGPNRGELLEHLAVDYLHSEERTFTRGCLSPHLMLGRFLEQPTPHLIKLDADTEVHRPFARPLPADCVFGTLQFKTLPDESVQGGCMGLPVEVAERLFRSEILLDERLETAESDTSDPHLIHLANRRRHLGLGTFDWSIAWACRQLGIPIREFEDVRSLWQRRPKFDRGEFAITHPRTDKIDILDDPDAEELRARWARIGDAVPNRSADDEPLHYSISAGE